MQEVDAQRRLAILRGEAPPPIEDSHEEKGHVARASDSQWRSSGTRRQRKRAGEDDTDFELRVAKDKASAGDKSADLLRQATSSAPIVDHAGNIDLFGEQVHVEKNEEAERETHKKKREYEDQYTMRFSKATGHHGTSNPWYSTPELSTIAAEESPKNVFGNDDPRRKERAAQRLSASDPLAMMKRGAAKVREIGYDRKVYQEERDEELRQLRKEEKRRERRRSRSPRSRRRRSRSPRGHERDQSRDRHRSRDRHGGRDRGKGRDDDRRRHSDSRRRHSRS